jgi:hypothetical protein
MPNEAGPRSSAYWLARAEEALTRSEGMHDRIAAETLRRVAEVYEQLARRAAVREAGPL